MKPVAQTLFGKGEGNCVAACVASILELALEAVPNFAKLYNFDWADHLESWLAIRGYAMIAMSFEYGWQMERMYLSPNLYVMMSGLSPRAEDGDTMRHAVVGLTSGRGIEVAYDPHPSGAGILMTHDVWVRFIVPIDSGETKRLADKFARLCDAIEAAGLWSQIEGFGDESEGGEA